MQTSKNFFVTCVIALLISTPSLRARESDAQAKAREEMRKKISELDAQEKGGRAPAPSPPTQTPPPVAAPVPAQPAPVQPAPVQPVAVQPEAVQPVAAPAPTGVDDEATARARAALREKMRELDAQRASPRAPVASVPPPPDAPVAAPSPAPVAVPAPVSVAAPAAQRTFAPTGQPEDEATARTRAALRQKMAELDAQQPKGRPAPAYAGQAASEPRAEFKPLTAPPLPISGPKEMRLAELLRQYKADQITPDVYHKQRAKILAEP